MDQNSTEAISKSKKSTGTFFAYLIRLGEYQDTIQLRSNFY